jgi:hypothetical protein
MVNVCPPLNVLLLMTVPAMASLLLLFIVAKIKIDMQPASDFPDF